MTCEEIDKIKDILKSGDYDLACQLWIGGHPRTGCLEELACIIITENIFKFYMFWIFQNFSCDYKYFNFIGRC